MHNLSDEELLDIIDGYSTEHYSFDNSFAESLRESMEQYDGLTSGQREAAEKIITRFRMYH